MRISIAEAEGKLATTRLLPSLENDQDLVFRPVISVHHSTVGQNDMRITQPLKL